MVELVDRERDEQLDPVLEHHVCVAERASLLGFRPLHSGRIRHTPMRRDRIAGPHRADFTSDLVADRKDEIHDRRTGPREFIPAFAVQPAGPEMELFESFEGDGNARHPSGSCLRCSL